MKKCICRLLVLLALFQLGLTNQLHAADKKLPAPEWRPWSDDVFKEATAQGKLVLLDLEAVWCHWCHVMDAETYSDPKIREILKSSYISLKVDQDLRPDLGLKYQDYGWPATIIFDPKGGELAKRSGFVEPDEMLMLLKKLAAHPVAEEEEKPESIKFSTSAELADSVRKELINRYYSSYDIELGGLKASHKYLEPDTVELAMIHTLEKLPKDEEIARHTINENFKLFDPVWGGVYQYSAKGNWDNPHFEKIMYSQTNNIYLYSLASSIWKDSTYLNAAQKIRQYAKDFLLSPEGAFYTSQDADVIRGSHSEEYFKKSDKERRKIGIPVVDTHIYSRENGKMIFALTALYAASGDESVLEDAKKAANWILAHRAIGDGCFRHDEKDAAGPYLGDTLAMGRAFLGLYMTDTSREWIAHAEKAAQCIAKNFINGNLNGDIPGYFTSVVKAGSPIEPVRLLEENLQMARFANLLFRYLGKEEFQEIAHHAMKYAATDKVALGTSTEPGVLIADSELGHDPLHMTIVGPKGDKAAKALYLAALAHPAPYKRLEWWDKKEGPMPNPDVQYPELSRPAAFICTNKRCSLPIFAPEGIAKTILLFEGDGGKLTPKPD